MFLNLLGSIRQDPGPEHVVTGDKGVPGAFKALPGKIRYFQLEKDMDANTAKGHGGVPAKPVGLLVFVEREGGKALGRIRTQHRKIACQLFLAEQGKDRGLSGSEKLNDFPRQGSGVAPADQLIPFCAQTHSLPAQGHNEGKVIICICGCHQILAVISLVSWVFCLA